MQVVELLSKQFNSQVRLVEKRPMVQQLIAPLYHEDGDMVSIFLDMPKDKSVAGSDRVKVSDHGLTLMRLSYDFDLDTPNKQRIFTQILAENGITEEAGALTLETTAESLYPAILQFAQTVAKVCNMRRFKREVLASLFLEMVDEFIMSKLVKYNVSKHVCPIADRDDLEVDYQLRPNNVPFFVFPVKDSARARLATIACLEFQKASLPFKSIAVHESFEDLTKKDRIRLTSACDKQFPSLEDFREKAVSYFDRELKH